MDASRMRIELRVRHFRALASVKDQPTTEHKRRCSATRFFDMSDYADCLLSSTAEHARLQGRKKNLQTCDDLIDYGPPLIGCDGLHRVSSHGGARNDNVRTNLAEFHQALAQSLLSPPSRPLDERSPAVIFGKDEVASEEISQTVG